MIKFNNVTIQEQEKTILHGVTFSVEKGEKVVFYGKSGSGKTTILHALLGGHRLTEGYIKFNGILLDKNSIKTVRTSIAYIGQEPVLGEGTVEQVLLLPFSFKAHATNLPNQSTLVNALEHVGLSTLILSTNVSNVSGGEKQRIAIARALLLKNEVFCIDEVTSALDIDSAEVVLSLFKNSRYTVISVSHDPRWFSATDRFIKIDNGTIISDTYDRSAITM